MKIMEVTSTEGQGSPDTDVKGWGGDFFAYLFGFLLTYSYLCRHETSSDILPVHLDY